ncbi:hypothetical protein TcG_04690 [Trypanosoma cruzi]|nr:hypothetical protein TcG_04690 [Trypanosoma cruzi]
MVFVLLRCLFTFMVFHTGVGYAVLLALRLPLAVLEEKEHAKKQNDNLNIPLDSLKIWIMITFLSSLSYMGAEKLPFFLEARAIFTWLLLLLPSSSHSKVYDGAFEPFFERACKSITGIVSTRMLARSVGLLFLRVCIGTGLFIANKIIRHRLLEEDEIFKVVRGLLYAAQALEGTEVTRPKTSRSLLTPPPNSMETELL